MYQHPWPQKQWTPLPQTRSPRTQQDAVTGRWRTLGLALAAISGVACLLHAAAGGGHDCCSTSVFSSLFSTVGYTGFLSWFGPTTSTTTTSTLTTTTTATITTTSTTLTQTITTTTTLVEEDLTLPDHACYFKYEDISQPGHLAAKCFCQLAGNAGCADVPCSCPQGCKGQAWPHLHSVTFRNRVHATGCLKPTALLTIPISYMKHVQFLNSWCPRGAPPLLVEMLKEGFMSYQTHVTPGAVRQCIHSGHHVSVPWMHLHTICHDGVVDNMFDTGTTAWCHTMTGVEEAEALATQIIAWARGPSLAELQSLPLHPPSTCAEVGCGMPGPEGQCSCSWNCPTFRNCCRDYRGFCLASCKQMGCGHFISGSNCSCEVSCQSNGNCCPDYHGTCSALMLPKVTPIARRPALAQRRAQIEHDANEESQKRGNVHAETCQTLGCGNRGRHCSCNEMCKRFDDCCEDYVTCPAHTSLEHRCSALGCGRRGAPGSCSCNLQCDKYNDCCADYESTCRIRKLLLTES